MKYKNVVIPNKVIKYQNGPDSLKFCHLSGLPMMLFGLWNKLILFVDHYQTPCRYGPQAWVHSINFLSQKLQLSYYFFYKKKTPTCFKLATLLLLEQVIFLCLTLLYRWVVIGNFQPIIYPVVFGYQIWLCFNWIYS